MKRTHNDTQHQNNAHRKNSPIECDGVQLTNVQCHMVPISISRYRESWTIQLKYTFETRQERITVSHHNTPSWPYQLLVCICLSERTYFNYLECSYNVRYVFSIKLSILNRTKVVRRKHIIQLTGFCDYSSTCFWWGCASAVGENTLPASSSSLKPLHNLLATYAVNEFSVSIMSNSLILLSLQ